MELQKTEEETKTDFCTECRKETKYILQKRDIFKTVRGKPYRFKITVAICTKCGAEMSPPGLIDKNVHEVDEQFRSAEDIISVNNIEKLMKIYNLDKASLSLSLGFDDNTVARYMLGQIPSKENSEIMRNALSSPAVMKDCLIRNKDKIDDGAYKTAMVSLSQIDGSPEN